MKLSKGCREQCIRRMCVLMGLLFCEKGINTQSEESWHCPEGDNPGCGPREDLGWPGRRDSHERSLRVP